MCDELKQANKIIKKLHDSNQEQTQKVIKLYIAHIKINLSNIF